MKRNLIYYCYFENSELNEFTQFNIDLVNRYLNVFDGQRIIKIAVDDLELDNSHLLSLFPNCDVQIVKNNKETRESEYFIESVKEIKEKNSLTFFGHNKGAKKQKNHQYEIMKHWVFSMYFFNLETYYLENIEKSLKHDKTFSGILRITTACPPWVESDWHYSGTFFWFNTEKLTNITGWDDFTKGRFSLESYPGKMTSLEKSNYTFCTENFNFNTYSNWIWDKYLNLQTLGSDIYNEYIFKFNTIFNKTKYTVVIPTLWKSSRTQKLIEGLVECEYVGEIIIIDNASTEECDKISTIHSKLRMVSRGKNIYVNPAWNWGIELAKNECIALCNDDINFDPNIFGAITENTLTYSGIIGMGEGNYKDPIDEERGPYLDVWKPGVNDWGWGCMILLNKKNWIDIPDDIKIWYGDNIIKDVNPSPKACLRNFKIETEMSTTSDEKEWDEVKKKDYENFINYLKNEKVTD